MKQITRNIFYALSLLACFALLPSGAQAVMLLQSEGFGGGSANGWGVASQVITIESDGGPEGAGDNFLSYTSTGSGSAGARMIIPNEDPGNPFHGDYQQAGVSALVFDVLNQGATDLDLRLAIGNGAAWYVSDPATKVTPGGPWSSVAFALDSGEMTALDGTDSLSEVLSDVIQIRLLSSIGLPSMGVAGPRGDQIAASIGIDNVRTIPEPSALLLFIAALACSRSRR